MTSWTGCEPGMPCGLCYSCKKRSTRGFRVIVGVIMFLVSLILLVFATTPTHAASYSQLQSDSTSTLGFISNSQKMNGTSSADTLHADYFQGHITSQTFKIKANLNDSIRLTVQQDADCIAPYGTTNFGQQTLNTSTTDVIDFVFTIDFTTDIGKCYSLILQNLSTDGGNNNWVYGAAGPDTFPTGYRDNTPGAANDSYFILNDPSSPFQEPPEVEITYPANGSTISDANFNWTVNTTKNTTSTLFLRMFYKVFSTSTFSYEDGDFVATEGSSQYPKGTPLFTGSYDAQARLYDSLGNQVATSTTINFFISFGGASGAWSLASSTTCADVDLFATATYVGQFANSILEGGCKAGVFLFYPSTSSVQQVVDIKDLIFDKPPIGYLVGISDALDLSTTTKAYDFPTSTLAALKDDFTDPFDLAFAPIPFLYWGVWIFRRFANKNTI